MAKLPPPIRVEPNPFGDFTEEQLNGAPGANDKFYLAGYSDKRHERELAIKAGEKPATLPRRFQYVSIENAGVTNKAKYVEWLAKGYRAVQYDELKALGIDPEKSTCERGPDGTARVASQLLMVCDAPVAAHHFKKNQELIDQQFSLHVKEPLDTAVERYHAATGRTARGPTFEIEETITEYER